MSFFLSRCPRACRPVTAGAARRRLWFFALLATFLGTLWAQNLHGAEQLFAAHNCAITPPEGWSPAAGVPDKPGLIGKFQDPAKQSILILLVDDKKKATQPIDEQFVNDFEHGLEESGAGKRIWGKIVEVGGVKAYERLGRVVMNDKTVSTLSIALHADEKFYNLQAMRLDGDASLSGEIQQAVASFRFLTPPSTPLIAGDHLNPTAYRIGVMIGRASVWIIVIVAGIIVWRRMNAPTPEAEKPRKPQDPPSFPPREP